MKTDACPFLARGAAARLPRAKWALTPVGAVEEPRPYEPTTIELLATIARVIHVRKRMALQILAAGERVHWRYSKETRRWTIL